MKKNPSSSIWGSTSSKANRVSQFQQVHMAVSIAVFAASPVVEVRRGERGNSEPTLFKQLAGKNARCISRLILTREFLFSFVWSVRLALT
jgi:hypothetical protein